MGINPSATSFRVDAPELRSLLEFLAPAWVTPASFGGKKQPGGRYITAGGIVGFCIVNLVGHFGTSGRCLVTQDG